MPSTASASTDPSRILIRAPNWLGDCVMSMPAVQRIRERFPDAHIGLLAREKVIELWRNNPHLNERIPLADLGSVRDARFEMAILFPNSFRVAWEAWRAAIPRRIGYDGDWRRPLLTDVIPGNPRHLPAVRHLISHYLSFARFLGGSDELTAPRIVVDESELREADRLVGAPGTRQLCALAPSAEYGPAKRWPAERFIETAKRLAAEQNVKWVVLGGPNDLPVCNPITAAIGESAINLVGKTNLRQLCAVLARCRLLLTNDSGAMHVGYAVGTKVLALFGSTEPSATGPVGEGHVVVRHKVDCSPCFLRECPIDFRCMKRIAVDEVVDRATDMLTA